MINKKPSLLPVYHNYCLSECFNFFKAYIAEAESSKQRVQDEKEVGRLLLDVLTYMHVQNIKHYKSCKGVLALCGQWKFKMAIIILFKLRFIVQNCTCLLLIFAKMPIR